MIFGLFKPQPLSPRQASLKLCPLFDSLTPLELKIVDGLMHERRFLGDEIVFDEGEEGQALYLITAGRVVISQAHDSAFRMVAELGPGAVFGDLALLDDTARNAQARAVGQLEVAVFFRADFLGLMETDAKIGYKIALALARLIGQRLRESMGGAALEEAL
ncbi:cyclic nucleotide-binding domain-containing protein [Massilia sp. TSP1-1-2]|uniref:cyclic nucleotide-binding domain-containing protein n=1 Tax=unclassified Massilia TaxID=2609279 RepID=UPI003CF516DB